MQRGWAALAGFSLLACRPQPAPTEARDLHSATIDVTSPEGLHGQACVDIFNAPRLLAAAAFADQHGLLIGGYIENSEAPGGQLLMVDASGALVWQREIEFSLPVTAIVPWEQGYAILVPRLGPSSVLKVSRAGELSTLVEFENDADAPHPHTILAHEGRLLLAGERARDLWIGYLGEAGELETMIVEDPHGFRDSVVQLLASEDELVALARVGVANGVDFDLVAPDPSETHVISYTHTGRELARAILPSDGNQWSTMVGNAMVRGPTGNIVVAGHHGNIRERVEFRAWAAGVVGSEVEWMQWWSGPALPDDERPWAKLSVATRVGPEVLLAGHVQSPAGERRWHLRVDPATGAVHDEFIATERLDGNDGYRAAAVESPHVAWLIGDSHTSGTATLWACRVTDTSS
jgi:hypothetical protein